MKSPFFVLMLLGSKLCMTTEIAIPGFTNAPFSLESLPCEGKIEFKMGENSESIEFGKNKNQYAMGLVFEKKHLPESFVKSFGDRRMIQIALGNQGSNAQELMTQFGSLSLTLNKMPSATPTKILMQDISKPKKDTSDSAFMIFNSSQAQFSAEDQEKLKTTFFSESGEVTVSTADAPEAVWIKHEGKRLPFKRQLLTVNLTGTVGTPFNNDKGKISGTFKTPVFWPANKESSALLLQLAKTQLDKTPGITPPVVAPRTLASPDDSKRQQ